MTYCRLKAIFSITCENTLSILGRRADGGTSLQAVRKEIILWPRESTPLITVQNPAEHRAGRNKLYTYFPKSSGACFLNHAEFIPPSPCTQFACGKLVMCIGLAQAQISCLLTMSSVDFPPTAYRWHAVSLCLWRSDAHDQFAMHMFIPCREKLWFQRSN